MNNLCKITTTNDPVIITDGHALYDVKIATFLTKRYSYIQQRPFDESSIPTYLVSDVVTSYDYRDDDSKRTFYPINKETSIVDSLSFVMMGKIELFLKYIPRLSIIGM